MIFSSITLAAKEAAIQAGKLLKEGFSSSFHVYSKEGNQNLVTEYDLASQKQIIGTLQKQFPSHHYLAEEEGLDTFSKDTQKDTVIWVIDPLDGTVNYAHRIPFFSVSIAAVQNGQIISAAIYHPLLQELFIAEKGKGAYLNGAKLQVSSHYSFEQALMCTGFPYNGFENPDHCLERFNAMTLEKATIRRLGSAALEIAYVAAGRLDLFWEQQLKPWDVAAAHLVLEEAGGQLTLYNGHVPSFLNYSSVLATNGKLHPQAISIFDKVAKTYAH